MRLDYPSDDSRYAFTEQKAGANLKKMDITHVVPLNLCLLYQLRDIHGEFSL